MRTMCVVGNISLAPCIPSNIFSCKLKT